MIMVETSSYTYKDSIVYKYLCFHWKYTTQLHTNHSACISLQFLKASLLMKMRHIYVRSGICTTRSHTVRTLHHFLPFPIPKSIILSWIRLTRRLSTRSKSYQPCHTTVPSRLSTNRASGDMHYALLQPLSTCYPLIRVPGICR